MAQDQPEEALELEEVLVGAAVVAEWAAVDSERVENAYAPIVATGQLIKEARPATR